MKLNNRGWGLSFLIIVGVIFLLVLIFISIKIKSLTKQVKKENTDNNQGTVHNKVDNQLFEQMEIKLSKAGESYTVFHSTLVENTTDHLIVTFETLKSEGFIESLPEPDGTGDCDGYVMIKNDSSVNSFIKCKDYKTLNYDLWKE